MAARNAESARHPSPGRRSGRGDHRAHRTIRGGGTLGDAVRVGWHDGGCARGAHLASGSATIAYLDRTDPAERPDDELLTAVTYFHAAIDSPIHDRIKEVSAGESAIGHAATAERFAELVADLVERLATEPSDRLIAALGGRMISLDDFCRTRLIEVLTHLDDLAASIDAQRPPTDPEGIAIVNEILFGIARHLRGDWTVMRALSPDRTRRRRAGLPGLLTDRQTSMPPGRTGSSWRPSVLHAIEQPAAKVPRRCLEMTDATRRGKP